MKKPEFQRRAVYSAVSLALISSMAYAADLGKLKDASGQAVRTGAGGCVDTSGDGIECPSVDTSAAPAPAAAAAPAADAGKAMAAPAAAAASAAADSVTKGPVMVGDRALRAGFVDCVNWGGPDSSVCPEGAVAAAPAAEAPAVAVAKPAKQKDAMVAGPAPSDALPGISPGHLAAGFGMPVRTGVTGDCINLGFSLGSDHPADCLLGAPVAQRAPAPAPVPAPAVVAKKEEVPVAKPAAELKTPDAPDVAATAAVPEPMQLSRAEPTSAGAEVATVSTETEGASAESVTDPATRWSRAGAVIAPASEAGAVTEPVEEIAAPEEVALADTAPPELQSPESPGVPHPADVPPAMRIGRADISAPEDVAIVPTDPESVASDEITDPATRWSRAGAVAAAPEEPAEVGGAIEEPVAEIATAQPPGDLQSPEPYTPAAPAQVPEPMQIARSEPAPVPAPPPAPEPQKVPAPEYEKFTLGADALFRFNKYDRKNMLPDGRAKLDELAGKLMNYTGVREIDLTGHTDRIGTHAYNDRLSKRRAATVKQYLQSKGVDGGLMKTFGKGKREPVVYCQGKKVTKKLIACLQPNRRVDVEVRGERQKPN